MKNLPFFIFIGFLQSCSLNSFDQDIEYRVNPELKPYVDLFYEEAEKRGIKLQRVNLYMNLDSSDKVVNPFKSGASFIQGSQKTVLIDTYSFQTNTDIQNEVLVFHELGHTLLNKSHDDSGIGIMNTYLISNDSIYKKNRDAFLKHLFTLYKL